MNIIDKPYIDKKDYLLYNLKDYDLTYAETIACLLILLYEENNLNLTYEDIALRLKIDESDVDGILQGLVQKEYLLLNYDNGSMKFVIDGLFEKKEEVKDNDYNDLLRLCEEVFNRALNVTEMTILNDLMCEYPKEKIIWALREAEVYQKGEPNIYYVKGILVKHRDE